MRVKYMTYVLSCMWGWYQSFPVPFFFNIMYAKSFKCHYSLISFFYGWCLFKNCQQKSNNFRLFCKNCSGISNPHSIVHFSSLIREKLFSRCKHVLGMLCFILTKYKLRNTHTHTHTYIYIYIYGCLGFIACQPFWLFNAESIFYTNE